MKTHTIPRYNWAMTEQFFKELNYLEGRDYTLAHTKNTVTIDFQYQFQFQRYWDQWGRHIAPVAEPK